MPGSIKEGNNDIENRKLFHLPNKIFCDPVHGQISFHPLCVSIIDTPQFQRLRDIKQLGFVYTVYPGAVHNRFGHSLGVSYLSGKFLRELRNNQPELKITDKEILCIEIAGLCHDLGHGPFSHTWEAFMKAEKFYRGENIDWKHEKVSVIMFDYLITDNKLQKEFNRWNMNEEDIKFIKKLIQGEVTKDRAFLYQIVNNDASGLDVDKWDYYLRDCYYLGIQCNFEYERLIQFARVIDVDGQKTICFRDKVVGSVYNMFRTRYELYRLAYKHRVSQVIEKMFCDALHKADDKVFNAYREYFQFFNWTKNIHEINSGLNERLKNERNDVLKKFYELTDSTVWNALKYSDIPDVINIITAIEKRSRSKYFYRFITKWSTQKEMDEQLVKEEIANFIPESIKEICKSNDSEQQKYESIHGEHIIIQMAALHWGKHEKNPVNFVNFYSKDNPNKAFKFEEKKVEWMLPRSYQEIQFQVLSSRDDDAAFKVFDLCCKKYKEKNNII